MKFHLRTPLSILGMSLSLLHPGIASADIDKAVAAYQNKNYAVALQEFKSLANQGIPQAQYNVGLMYTEGQGVPQDYKEAIRWYRLAAKQGDADAQTNLGVMYEKGNGVPQDYKEAIRWYQLAAKQGDAGAEYNLGMMYYHGQGVSQDYKEAIRWCRLAAEQGKANKAKAVYALSLMYAYGRGVSSNLVTGYALANLSASIDSSKNNEAIEFRKVVSGTMQPKEINAGQNLTREMAISGNFLKALDNYIKAPVVVER